MKSKILLSAMALAALSFTQVKADDGGQMFRTNCGACHTVGKGKLVGPDLKGVETRHSDAWILKWVKSSQTLVQSGDKDAVKLFADNNSIVMPDQPLTEDQIKTVLDFIKTGGQEAATASTAAAPAVTGTDHVSVETQKAAVEATESGSLLTTFSFTEYLLLFLMGILVIAIYIMALSIKSLMGKIKQQNAQ